MYLTPDDEDTLNRVPASARVPVVVSDWGARSSIGLVRHQNEDAWGEADGRLFSVADGMGGAAGGARASSIAVAGFLSADPSDGWLHAMKRISQAVRAQCDAEGFPTAGTTFVGLVVEPSRCTILHVGDSRVYRLRAATIARLTTDHNVKNLRKEEGEDPLQTDSRGKPRALTAYIGNPDTEQRCDVGTVSGQPGDRLLLCSDGIHEQLSEVTLADSLGRGTCEEAAAHLVRSADLAGGRDNSTALVIDLGLAT